MPTLYDIVALLESFAPPSLAEEWDNVGLLVGDRSQEVRRVMTCLTLTENVAAEAIDREVDMVVTHHPMLFRPLRRLTTDTPEGRVLWNLAGAGIAIYSPHTAFDSTAKGINEQWAGRLNLADAAPLVPDEASPTVGAGRHGLLPEPTTLRQLASNVCQSIHVDHLHVVGEDDREVRRVAIACGSGGSLLTAAVDSGADVLITGEATFHTLLAAEAAGIAMLLVGHYASERFALEWLAEWLVAQTQGVEVWASATEHDPRRLLHP